MKWKFNILALWTCPYFHTNDPWSTELLIQCCFSIFRNCVKSHVFSPTIEHIAFLMNLHVWTFLGLLIIIFHSSLIGKYDCLEIHSIHSFIRSENACVCPLPMWRFSVISLEVKKLNSRNSCLANFKILKRGVSCACFWSTAVWYEYYCTFEQLDCSFTRWRFSQIYKWCTDGYGKYDEMKNNDRAK